MSSTTSERSETSEKQSLQHTGSRAAWISEWMKMYPNRPAPCSAKSIYRLADSPPNVLSACSPTNNYVPGLGLDELKERAAQVGQLCPNF